MKIAIVNDVPLIAEALRRLVAALPGHEIVWIAHAGVEAVQQCARLRPDLLLMDLIMPGMDGVATIGEIMRRTPCAILVVTASPEDNTALVFRALGAGALDVVATPVLGKHMLASDTLLAAKIKTMGRLLQAERLRPLPLAPSAPPTERLAPNVALLVTIGASTGGPAALASLLGAWQPGPRTAVVVVQHIDAAFADGFSRWLATQTGCRVETAVEGAPLAPGHVLVAKTNDHLLLDAEARLRYRMAPAGHPCRPAVDVFFQSVATHWAQPAVGVLLTGMGRDGAAGLLALRNASHLTLAQDAASSAVYGMPRAAALLGAAQQVQPPEGMAATIARREAELEAVN